MNYTPINWQNGEYGNTPLNADNLNHMDNAIKTIAEESKANTESIEYCQEDIEANAGKIEENTDLISGLRTDVTELQEKISGDIAPNSVNTHALTAAEGNFTNVTVSGNAVIPTIKGNNAAVSMPNGISTTDVAANKTESRTVESVSLNTTNLTATGYVELVGPTIKRGRYDDMPCIYGEDTRKINFPNGIEVSGELNVNTFTANESVIDELRVDAIRASYNPQKRTLEIEPKISANDIDCTNIKAVGYLECGIIESAGIHSTEEIIDGHGNVLSEVAANVRDNTAISLTCDINSTVTDSAERTIVGIDALGHSEQHISKNLSDVAYGKFWINSSPTHYDGVDSKRIALLQPVAPRKTYTLSFETTEVDKTIGLYCRFCDENFNILETWSVGIPAGDKVSTFYLNNAQAKYACLFFVCDSFASVSASTIWNIQLTEGSTALPYEPYTGIPTPTNPVPIVDASDINLCGNYQIGKSWNGTSNANRGYVEANLVAGATYTISFNGNKDDITTLALFCVNDDSEATYSINYSLTDNNVTKYTFVCPANAKRARALIVSNAVVTQELMDSKEIQIERGASASAYVPYGCARVTARTQNLLINEWENKTANNSASSIRLRSTNLIKVEANKTYTAKIHTSGTQMAVAVSYEDTAYPINNIAIDSGWKTTYVVTPTSDGIIAIILKHTDNSAIAPTENIIVQVEEGTTATDYVPYASNSISIPFAMRSIGDIHDELIIDKNGGRYIQRVGYADMSTLSWYDGTGSAYWYSRGLADKVRPSTSTTEIPNILCTTLTANTRNVTTGKGTNFITVYSNGNIVATSTEKPDGILLYELATPIITDLEPGDLDYIVSLYTYKPITVFDTKCIGTVSYAGDIESYIDNKFNYSYTDRIIGKWADGKDLHQMVIQTTTPRAINTDAVVSNLITKNNASVKNISGIVETGNYQIQINMYYSGSYNIATFININGIVMRTPAEAYTNCPCEIIVEYTLK